MELLSLLRHKRSLMAPVITTGGALYSPMTRERNHAARPHTSEPYASSYPGHPELSRSLQLAGPRRAPVDQRAPYLPRHYGSY